MAQLRLSFTERPTNEEIEGESEVTKKPCNNCDALEVHDDLVYRKFVIEIIDDSKSNEGRGRRSTKGVEAQRRTK